MTSNNKSSPYFPLYPADLLSRTFHLTQAEFGALMRLVMVQWMRGYVPVEPKCNQKLAGGEVSEAVLEFFDLRLENQMQSSWIENIRFKKSQVSKAQSDKGKLSAQKRWLVEPRLDSGSSPVEPRLDSGSSPVEPRLDSGSSPVEPESNPSVSVSVVQSTLSVRESVIPTWAEIAAFCVTIGLVEWRARKAFSWQESQNWDVLRKGGTWRKYFLHIRVLWEQEGRPMTPPAGTRNTSPHPPRATSEVAHRIGLEGQLKALDRVIAEHRASPQNASHLDASKEEEHDFAEKKKMRRNLLEEISSGSLLNERKK